MQITCSPVAGGKSHPRADASPARSRAMHPTALPVKDGSRPWQKLGVAQDSPVVAADPIEFMP